MKNPKKRILILTHQFLPDNIIAARRPLAYANNFHLHGIDATVVTHNWERDQKTSSEWKWHDAVTPVLEEKETHYRIFKVPRVKTRLHELYELTIKIPGLSKPTTLLLNLLGFFDLEILGSYSLFKKFLFKHLETHSYDLIIGLYSPYYTLRLCKRAHDRYSIPYITDWRDLYDLRLGDSRFRPSLKDKIQLRIQERWIKRWLGKSLFVTSAGKFWAEYLGRLVGKSGYEITNGFERNLFDGVEPVKSERFIISHIGTLYEEQDIEIFLSGIRDFLKEEEKNVRINFVGLKGKMIERVEAKARQFIPVENLVIKPRILREEAVNLKKSSHILFYPCWLGVKGIYSGKIFEYIGSRRPILLSPGDQDYLDDLIKVGNFGQSSYTPEEVTSFVQEKYEEWLTTGDVTYGGKERIIEACTREHQVQKMSMLIKQYLT